VFCLGVKDALPPRAIGEREVARFVEGWYSGWPAPPVEAPIDLARQLVWGAVAYARGLGFEPAQGFDAPAQHLGELEEERALTFARDGRPGFVQRAGDDAASIVKTLEGSVGKDNFEFVANPEQDHRGADGAGGRKGAHAGSRQLASDVHGRGRMWR